MKCLFGSRFASTAAQCAHMQTLRMQTVHLFQLTRIQKVHQIIVTVLI